MAGMEKLSVGNLIRTGEYYDRVHSFTYDVPFYLKHAARLAGPVLELGCGTGRITLPLATLPLQIVGVDLAAGMLKTARQKQREANAENVRFLRADIRKLRLQEKFSLVMVPFNSLQDIYTWRDLGKVFDTVRAHLKKRGLFIFDILNPDLLTLSQGVPEFEQKFSFTVDRGQKVEIWQKMTYDKARQCNRIVRSFSIDGKVTDQPLDQRIYFPVEMDALLELNGFRVVKKFGDFDESPFSATSPKQIYICEAK